MSAAPFGQPAYARGEVPQEFIDHLDAAIARVLAADRTDTGQALCALAQTQARIIDGAATSQTDRQALFAFVIHHLSALIIDQIEAREPAQEQAT